MPGSARKKGGTRGVLGGERGEAHSTGVEGREEAGKAEALPRKEVQGQET